MQIQTIHAKLAMNHVKNYIILLALIHIYHSEIQVMER